MEQEFKKCKICGRELPIDQFQRNRAGGRHSICKECMALRMKEGKKNKGEKIRSDLESQIVAARNTRLQDYTGRELMEELARRGYKGKLVVTVEKEIDITNF